MIVIHPSAADLPTDILATCERIGKAIKPGATHRFFSKAGEFRVTRGRGMDTRLHVSREITPMPPLVFQPVRVRATAAGPAPVAPGPEVWGPPLWREIHTSALTLETPEARQQHAAGIVARVPCGECKAHWKEWSAAHPARVATAEEYFAWTVEAHNAVNTRQGKPTLTVEFSDAQKKN